MCSKVKEFCRFWQSCSSAGGDTIPHVLCLTGLPSGPWPTCLVFVRRRDTSCMAPSLLCSETITFADFISKTHIQNHVFNKSVQTVADVRPGCHRTTDKHTSKQTNINQDDSDASRTVNVESYNQSQSIGIAAKKKPFLV